MEHENKEVVSLKLQSGHYWQLVVDSLKSTSDLLKIVVGVCEGLLIVLE